MERYKKHEIDQSSTQFNGKEHVIALTLTFMLIWLSARYLHSKEIDC